MKPTERKPRKFRENIKKHGPHPEDIKAALRKSGSSQASSARELGCFPSSVSNIIAGRESSRRVATHIANKLGKTLNDLWPGQYD